MSSYFVHMNKTTPKSKQRVVWENPLSKQQLILMGAGLAVIVIGFLLLSAGLSSRWDNPLSVSVAPVVLVIGYCVVIPWAIMAGSKSNKTE